MDAITIPYLFARKLRHTEDEKLAKDHTASLARNYHCAV